jgi:5-methylcytosine-specific restriction endonuclease McrA
MADSDYQRLGRACHCGQPVKLWSGNGRPPKYCGDHKLIKPPKPRPVHAQKECPGCRGFFVPKVEGTTYCSADCARRVRRGSKPRQMWPLKCRECTASFESLNEKAMYCGNRCKTAAWVRANPQRHAELRDQERRAPKVRLVSRVYAGHCRTCAGAFVSRSKRPYCSEGCRPNKSVLPECKTCRVCANTFKPISTGGSPGEFCSDECRTIKKRAIHRVHRLRRKAKQRGVTVESVDPFKVFDRDRWRCQLCGVKTPKAKRGTYEHDAPELDHIIPLARGGEHSYRNTQCACRRCNGAKADEPRGQLLLIG